MGSKNKVGRGEGREKGRKVMPKAVEKRKRSPTKKSEVEGKENVARDWWEINQEKDFE